jgi:uncharacterized Zn finger protein (UPF0148 family)
MNQKQTVDLIKQNGSLLLDGWKMISSVCPICASPLFTKENTCICTSCNAPVIAESESTNKILLQNGFNKIDDSKLGPDETDGKTYVFESLNEKKREYDLSHGKRVDNASKKLAEMMLSGWTLLAENCNSPECQGVPLLGKKDGSKYCVSCQKKKMISQEEYNDSKSGQLHSSSKKLLHEDLNEDRYRDMSNAPNLEYSAPPTDDASSLIGGKLLIGWKLLDQTCDRNCNGNTPLMRDKNGRVIYTFSQSVINRYLGLLCSLWIL